MKENAQTSKRYQRGFEPGLSRLRVRHSTTEPPRSTNESGVQLLYFVYSLHVSMLTDNYGVRSKTNIRHGNCMPCSPRRSYEGFHCRVSHRGAGPPACGDGQSTLRENHCGQGLGEGDFEIKPHCVSHADILILLLFLSSCRVAGMTADLPSPHRPVCLLTRSQPSTFLKSLWHASFHLVFGRPLFLFSGINILNTILCFN